MVYDRKFYGQRVRPKVNGNGIRCNCGDNRGVDYTQGVWFIRRQVTHIYPITENNGRKYFKRAAFLKIGT